MKVDCCPGKWSPNGIYAGERCALCTARAEAERDTVTAIIEYLGNIAKVTMREENINILYSLMERLQNEDWKQRP